MSTEHPSMTTQQPQEMVTIFGGKVEPSPSTIRALLPTPPILQSKVSLNEGCVVCRTIPNPTNHFTFCTNSSLLPQDPLWTLPVFYGVARQSKVRPTRTLAAHPIGATWEVTILLLQTFFQLAKIAARGSTVRPLEPQATLRAKIAARGSTVLPLEPPAPLRAKVRMDH